jgi:hypothetical protein
MAQALGDTPTAKWLEPSHGHGSFVAALAAMGVPKQRIRAIDIDPVESPYDLLANTARGIDFLEWSSHTIEQFDRVIGNPPFLAINRLTRKLRKVAAGVRDFEGVPIGLSANTWYAFALSSIRLLREDGNLAFILPSAVEYAEYSRSLRKTIRNQFSSVQLFRCRQPLFDNVQEGTIVVIARGYNRGPFVFRRREFANPKKLIAALRSASRDKMRECRLEHSSALNHSVRFSDVAEVRLGGVTGDSDYFLLSDKQRCEQQLPKAACVPVVTRARHLRRPVITRRTWMVLKKRNERVWLFRPETRLRTNRNVRRYLRKAFIDGGCNLLAYKVRIRKPWYKTPLPRRASGFISGMSQCGPWICLNSFPKLNATNTLYVVTFKSGIGEEEIYWYSLALLSSPAQQQLRRCARRYADGLIKYEPSAFANLTLPKSRKTMRLKISYKNAVQALLEGKRQVARALADRVLGLKLV